MPLNFASPVEDTPSAETPWKWRPEFLAQLVSQIPALLQSQKENGQFGTGIWIVTDQNALLPLAVAWATDDPANPYYHSPAVLEAIGKGGDALIAAQTPLGKWVFRKKDNSTWGDIYMPWTYSRWIRAYALVKNALPPERRIRWEKALTLGYTGIAQNELKTIHNIPTHHAMGLYIAGEALNHPEWKTEAAQFLHKVAASQNPGGFWSENSGPVVGYNFVYTDALGVYYGQSQDQSVLPALLRAARFHAAMTYPDGSAVETVDERQIYHSNVAMPNVGFAWTPEGRGYAKQQWERIKQNGVLSADIAASYLQFGGPDNQPAVAPPGASNTGRSVLGANDALASRSRPWFFVLSAYTAPVPTSRWIQDRQNLVSVFHDKAGLILGGGNTKLTPLWSTFTVGELAQWVRAARDENPNFIPPAGLLHVPTAAKLNPDTSTLALTYGGDTAGSSPPVHCSVSVVPDAKSESGDILRLIYACDPDGIARETRPIAAHLPFLVHVGNAWRTASGRSGMLSQSDTLHLTAGETGEWLQYGQWRVSVPPGAFVDWPVRPHDSYVKDGTAVAGEWRLVMSVPFSAAAPRQEVVLSVLPPH